MVGAFPGALDDSLPCRRVRFLEARKEPNERSIGRGLDALVERGQQNFAPAALKDLGIGDDIADETIAVTQGASAAAVHALAGFLSLCGGRIALGVYGLLRGIGFDDQAPKIVGRL